MASTCPSPEKCLFAGCSGDCQPPIAAFLPADRSLTAGLRARDILWRRRPKFAPVKLRDARAHRRLLIGAA